MSDGKLDHDGARGDAEAWLRRLSEPRGLWLSIFVLSLALFLIRFLIPTPVGQADNRDGARLMCGALGLNPVVPGHFPRSFEYPYFAYVPGTCSRAAYVTSELGPLAIARLLTPAFGLRGSLNLIALGVVMCVIASIAIASLASGLRVRPWAKLLIAAGLWLIVADSAFFDLFASPYSEPAAIAGLLLVAAGLVYLGRDRRASVRGLTLSGIGGFLVVLSKEEYMFLAVPICLALVLASTTRDSGRGLARFRTPQARAAVVIAAVLALSAAAYHEWNVHSPYGVRTQPMRVVDTIFEHIANPGDKTKAADLRALGLPASWAKYAGTYYWDSYSVRNNPLYPRYAPVLTDSHMSRYFLTHPGQIISVGEQAADEGLRVQVTELGDYPPYAGHGPGAVDRREAAFSWLAQRLPPTLGLLWLALAGLLMAGLALAALRWKRRPWHRDGAVLVLCMTGCVAIGFIPPAYFDGISTARHMAVMNLALALAFAMTVALAVSMAYQAARRAPRRAAAAAEPSASQLARNR